MKRSNLYLTNVIDGEYYYVDVTWDDPTWDVSGRTMHTNFLCSFEDFKQHHHKNGIIDYDTTPSSTKYDDCFWRDCNGDGCIDVRDVALLAQILANWNVHPGRVFNK